MARMNSENNDEHKRLASIVKRVHADLRKKLKASNGDYESVWHQHCQDGPVLSEYAESMQSLAVQHWAKKSQTRIDWCHSAITEYFLCGGMKKAMEKDAKRLKHRLERQHELQRQHELLPEKNAIGNDIPPQSSHDQGQLLSSSIPNGETERTTVTFSGNSSAAHTIEPNSSSSNYRQSATNVLQHGLDDSSTSTHILTCQMRRWIEHDSSRVVPSCFGTSSNQAVVEAPSISCQSSC